MREVCSGSWRPDEADRGLLRSRSSRARARATTSATCAPTSCSRCRRRPDEWVHRDELLFQTVHQSSELWLKLAWNDVEAAAAHLARAARSRRRCACCAARALCLATRRRSSTCSSRCRRGSTRRSARCSATAAASTRPAGARCGASRRSLGQAFHALREQARALARRRSTSSGREHEELYQLAEALIEWDERITTWRIRHYKVVARIIGDSVVGTQGTPVEVLGRLIHHELLPGALARSERADRAAQERRLTRSTRRPTVGEMWGGGLRARCRAARTVHDVLATLARAAPGERWLDVGTGTAAARVRGPRARAPT